MQDSSRAGLDMENYLRGFSSTIRPNSGDAGVVPWAPRDPSISGWLFGPTNHEQKDGHRRFRDFISLQLLSLASLHVNLIHLQRWRETL
jgi:hypothetical protein